MIKRYLIAGLLFWLPVWVTLLILRFVVELLDSSFSLLPHQYQPEQLLGMHLPGLGVLVSVLVVFFTGMMVTNFLGRRLVALWDGVVARIPLVRSIHSAVKQVSHTILSPNGQAFRKVLLVEYPRKGLWSLAFLTAEGLPVVEEEMQQPMMTIFVPTTPNPTSGFLILVSKEDVREIDMNVETALKLIISLGVVQPKVKPGNLAPSGVKDMP